LLAIADGDFLAIGFLGAIIMPPIADGFFVAIADGFFVAIAAGFLVAMALGAA
jgi:hypothetical protein